MTEEHDPSLEPNHPKVTDEADPGAAPVQKLQAALQRNQQRYDIEAAIDASSVERGRSRILLLALFYVNIGVLAAMFWFGGGPQFDSAGNSLLSLARACGLLSSYLLLVQLLLVGRIPAFDRIYGVDRLTRWHKINGHISFDLALAHAYFAVVGRSVENEIAVGAALSGVLDLQFMWPAVIGLLMITLAIATSITSSRRKIGFNRWHFFHIWTYVGVLLSFGHQLFGPDTLGRPEAQAYLWMTYIVTFGLLFYFRVVTPIAHSFRHQLRVAKIEEEAPGVTSLYLTGFRLDELHAQPGQFFWWRFMYANAWWESHPFSLSAAPNSEYLRITVKGLGDFSSGISQIPIGTWVTFEGPFGVFTSERRTEVLTVLLACGVGITPIRSLLEGIPTAPGDITVIYRSDSEDDAVLLQEIRELAAKRRATLHLVLGARELYPANRQPLSPAHLGDLVPDILHRDVYICAPPVVTDIVRATLKTMGLREQQVHYEKFL